MATIHPSRSSLVPASETSIEEIDRERELREKLELSRRKRKGEESSNNGQLNDGREPSSRSHDRKASPSNDRHHPDSYRREPPPPARYGDQYDRPPHFQYDPRVPPPGWQGSHEQEQGPPPPGAWGRRQEGGSRPAPVQGGFQENRIEQRKATALSIWPPSPTSPYRSSDEEDRRKSSSKHKNSKRRSHRSRKHSNDEDSEEEERRRRRKRREKEKSRLDHDLDSEEEGRRRRKKRREKEREEEDERRHHRSKSHKRSHRRNVSETSGGDGDQSNSREKETSSSKLDKSPERSPSRALVPAHQDLGEISEPSDTAIKAAVRIGPQLPQQATSQTEKDDKKSDSVDHRAYGKALLPGEGSAMANYVQEGKRIPRRGEIGLSSDQIESFEKVGYVMSGSRHQRMNAVRMRKENQIISAEEQRSILRMRAEEKQKKEAEIVAQVRLLL